MRSRLVVSAALLAAALGVVPAADAASSKRCRALAGSKAKVVAQSKDALVVRRGKRQGFTLTYYGCLFAKPRLVKLPGQNGGDTELYDRFRLNGRYLAYVHTNAEEASFFTPSWVETVDLKSRKRVSQYDAFPDTDTEEDSGAPQILLRSDGAVAWIGFLTIEPTNYSVQTALLGQEKPAEVDRGTDVDPKSLRRVDGNDVAFSWTRGGVRKEAAFGGPTVTP